MLTLNQIAKLSPEEKQAEIARVQSLISQGHTYDPTETQGQGIVPQVSGIISGKVNPLQGIANIAQNFVTGAGRAALGENPEVDPSIANKMNQAYTMSLMRNSLSERNQIDKENRAAGQTVPVYGYNAQGKYGPLQDDEGNPIMQPKTAKTASMGFGVANVAIAKEAAPGIKKAYEAGDVVPFQSASPQAKTIIAGQLGAEGKDMTEPTLGFAGEKSIIRNASVEDAKVNTAIKLRNMIDTNTDAQGNILLPPNMHTELAIGVARMLSPSGIVPIELEQQLRQGTLREKAANLAIFMGADPKEVGGTTQSVAQFFKHTIERIGTQAENQREQYLKGGRSSFKNNLQGGNQQPTGQGAGAVNYKTKYGLQ